MEEFAQMILSNNLWVYSYNSMFNISLINVSITVGIYKHILIKRRILNKQQTSMTRNTALWGLTF